MNITGLTIVAVVLIGVSRSLPISQMHRFQVYTPYMQPQRFNCGMEPCASDQVPQIKTAKRTKPLYKTGWTMGGMPFSVLYMNPKPQISVRSPVAEPLRALPPSYDENEFLFKEPPVSDNYGQDVQAQALVSGVDQPVPSPTLGPTRRQYSIIPQLFVSYGWGPLGK